MILAHIAGVPIEEALLAAPGAVAVGLLVARAWIASYLPSRDATPTTQRRGPGSGS